MGLLTPLCASCCLRYVCAPSLYACVCLSRPPAPLSSQLDASEAARQAQAATFNRMVGRGGLNEQAAEDMGGDGDMTAAFGFGGALGPSSGAGARRTGAQVSEAQVVRHPSEAERVLRLLQQQIGKLGMSRCASVLSGYECVV